MKKLRLATALAVAGLAFSLAPAAQAAIATNVQLSTSADGNYDVTGINEFDWQSSGDLVIENSLAGGSAVIDGVVRNDITTFSAWVAAANASGSFNNDTIVFDLHGHARLNDMLDVEGGGIAPATLDTNGSNLGDAGFEITAAFSGTESATMVDFNTLRFDTISGSYSFFFDTTPDSDVSAGTGFTNGDEFLTGALLAVAGTASFNADGSFSASTLLTNSITSYDSNIIEADPVTNRPLVGSTFDTLISLPGALQALVNVGGTVGLDQYVVVGGDLRLKADANSEFSANPVPEPGTLALISLGLVGAAFGTARKARGNV